MAFVSDPNAQDPTQGNQPGGANPLSQQAPITSAPPAGAGKAAVTPSNSAPSQPFTNLSSYLSANGPQLQQEGQGIANNLTTQYGQTMNDINAGSANFNSSVNSGYTPFSQPTVDAFSASPSAVAANPDQANAFKGMYNDTYTGPANFETSPIYGNLSGEVNTAVQGAKSLQTPEGIGTYFSSTSPNYTPGMAMLDSSLLQANPDVVSNISAAAQPFTSLPGYLSSTVTSADQNVQNAVQQAQAAKAAAQAAGSQASTDFSTRIGTTYQNDIQKAIDYNNNLNAITGKVGNQDFASLTPDQQKLIGFNPALISLIQQYPNIFKTQAQNNPINFANYFTLGDQAKVPNASDIVSPDDISTYQALLSLTGAAPNVPFTMPTTSTQGTFGTPGQPGNLPQYNDMQALAAIEQAYGPFYQQALSTGALSQDQINFMNSLRSAENNPQPSPQPTTPPPSDNGLGAGYHWDPTTGTWQVTIPLQPPNNPPSGGGGFHTF